MATEQALYCCCGIWGFQRIIRQYRRNDCRPDPLAVIVINVMIRDVQPLKLIQHIRAHAPEALIIALTSQPRAQVLSRVAGADSVLAWPPCGEALCATITEALELAHPYAPGPCSPTFEAGALAGR